MSQLENQTERLSKFTKNALYLAGIVASAFVGGAVAIRTIDPVLAAPEKLDELQRLVDSLELKVDQQASELHSHNSLVERSEIDAISRRLDDFDALLETSYEGFSVSVRSGVLDQIREDLGNLPDFETFATTNDISDFVRVNEQLRVYVVDANGTNFDMNVLVDLEDDNVLKVASGADLYLPYFRRANEAQGEISFRLDKVK